MATIDDLKLYVESLPPIYREILAAFPRIEPTRKAGYGLAYQTIAVDFEERSVGFTLQEIMLACQKLEQQKFVEIKNRIFVCPTDSGESLIAIISGQKSPILDVPELPLWPV